MNNPHTHFRQNQKVLVILRDGSRFYDRFFEHRSNFIVLVERGKLAIATIRAIQIPRGSMRPQS